MGAAFAAAYARKGATLAIADINLPQAESAANAIGLQAYAIELDVTDSRSIDAAMAQVTQRTGGIDILVNNAAVFDMAPIVEITRDSFKRPYAINVAGVRFTL